MVEVSWVQPAEKPEMTIGDAEYMREVLVRMGLTDETWLKQVPAAVWDNIWQHVGTLHVMLSDNGNCNP